MIGERNLPATPSSFANYDSRREAGTEKDLSSDLHTMMNHEGPGPRHVSVMPAEMLHYLAPKAGQVVVDATVGAGGHARLLAEKIAPGGRMIGLDQDPAMLELAKTRLQGFPIIFVQRNFDELRAVLNELHIQAVDGILADLGICSDQLDDSDRGLSFQTEGPLDMRMNPAAGVPAGDLLRDLSERELADMFWQWGEERFSRRIARRIVAVRRIAPIETTTQLADLVRRCIPRPGSRRHRIDPATRVFQALRIAVNDELGALERFLEALSGCLKPGGRVVMISFHSLEDRLVKRAFRDRQKFKELTKKAVQAGEPEIRNNPRARSAKLRAAEKLTSPSVACVRTDSNSRDER
jgi:16S rRNA (cytosine1402-N4)-methyltransferase